MNTLRIKGNWNETVVKFKQQCSNLTDNDRLYCEGKDEETLGVLQQKLGKAKEGVRKMAAIL